MEIINIKSWIIANLGAIIPILLFLIFCLLLFCLFLARTVEVLSAKIEVEKILKSNSLENFLEFAESAPVGTFDQAAEINTAATFVCERLNLKNAPEVITLLKRVSHKRTSDLKIVLKRALAIKGVDFWANLYFMAFIDMNTEKLEDMKDVFQKIYNSEERRALFTLYSRELQRYESVMLHAPNRKLAEAIAAEITAVKAAVVQEEFLW